LIDEDGQITALNGYSGKGELMDRSVETRSVHTQFSHCADLVLGDVGGRKLEKKARSE
jgi:hypothetical protein